LLISVQIQFGTVNFSLNLISVQQIIVNFSSNSVRYCVATLPEKINNTRTLSNHSNEIMTLT